MANALGEVTTDEPAGTLSSPNRSSIACHVISSSAQALSPFAVLPAVFTVRASFWAVPWRVARSAESSQAVAVAAAVLVVMQGTIASALPQSRDSNIAYLRHSSGTWCDIRVAV